MKNGSEALKLLSLLAASGVVVFALWLTLERGGQISALGKAPVEDEQQMLAIRTAETTAPPAPAAPTYRPREINPPSQQSGYDAATTSMYKWVDEKGTIHFSDRPGESGAERIAVAAVTTYNKPAVQPVYRQVSTNDVNGQGKYTSTQVNRSFQTERIGRGRFRTSEGHIITASGKHLGELLSFEGRVEGGTRCSALYLHGCMTSNSGKVHCSDAVATDVGGSGGRLFESQAVRVNRLKEGWEVTSISAYCR